MDQRQVGLLTMTFGILGLAAFGVGAIRHLVLGDSLGSVAPFAIFAVVSAAATVNGYRIWRRPDEKA